MENVTIAVRNGIAYIVEKSNPDIQVKIIDYDVYDQYTDVDSEGNKCIISIE